MHAPEVGWDTSPKVAPGYLFATVVCAALRAHAAGAPEPDDIALDARSPPLRRPLPPNGRRRSPLSRPPWSSRPAVAP